MKKFRILKYGVGKCSLGKQNISFWYGPIIGLALAATSLGACAQAAPRSIYLWSSAVGSGGLRGGIDGARLGTWGNGKWEDARGVLYEGAPTLKLTTRNFREGVRFDMKTPLDIEPYRDAGYLRFRLKFQDAAPVTGGMVGAPGGMGPGGLGNPPAVPGGGFGGGIAPPEVQGNLQMGPLPPLGAMGGLQGVGGEPIVTGPTPQQTELKQLMCTLVMESGIMEGTIDIPKQWDDPSLIDFDKVRPDANGWMLFVLPIKQMRSTPGASGQVKRLILSGDRQESFFMTQAALVVESGDMTVLIRRLSDPAGAQISEITVKPGPLTLVAEVEAGAADPAIEWNFDADNVGNLPPANPDGLPEGTAPGGGFPAVGLGAPAGLPGLPAAPAQPQGMPGAEGDAPVAGPRIDARGLVAKFEYPNEEQNYRVEVTVRDRSGKKDPVTSSILVRVRG